MPQADPPDPARGTSADTWNAAAPWRDWPAVEATALVPPGARCVVVAPHPDDEVVGIGGTLARLAAAGRDVLLVAVTDGDASHPGSAAWTPAWLAATRIAERTVGLRRLGLAAAPVRRLELPDGRVADRASALVDMLATLLRPGDVVCATWRLDGHPDHEATGRAAAVAAAAAGCRLYEYPVWMWHWARPGDDRVPWQRLRRLDLDADARAAKRHALAAHASQLVASPDGVAAVLPPWVVARLLRPFEAVFAPAETPSG